MHFVDYDTTKEKYYYYHFKIFFHIPITLDHCCLAINNARNFPIFLEFLVMIIMLICAKTCYQLKRFADKIDAEADMAK